MLVELDRTLTLFLNGSDSLYLDGVAWTATQTITWTPLAIVLFIILARRYSLRALFFTIVAIALCVLLADQVASGIFKPWVARLRPTHDPVIGQLIDTVNGYRGGRYGFFSSHAANTMALATFVSLVVRYRPLTVTLVSWSLLNCWTRVYLGVHFAGDLLVGLLWGMLVGRAVYFFWRRYAPDLSPRKGYAEAIKNRPTRLTPSGFIIQDAQMLIAAFFCSLIYVLV